MGAEQHVVAYTDFSGGEYGDLPVHEARSRGNMWHGSNIRRYRDGRLGPRAGLKAISISSVGNGILWGLGQTPSSNIWWIKGDTWYFNNAGAAQAASGAFSSTPTAFVRHKESVRNLNGFLYVSIYGGKTYSIGWTATPWTRLDLTDSDGQDIELYGERLALAAPGSIGVVYSEGGDFSTWDVSGYLPVGYYGDIYHVLAQRGGLTILKGDALWRVQGTLGGSNVLRKIARSLPPSQYGAVLDDSTDLIYYVPHIRSAPVTFDGATPDAVSLEHLDWNTAASQFEVMAAYSPENRDILFTEKTGAAGLLRAMGAWSFHTFGINPKAVTPFDTDKFVLATAGAAGSPPTFHYFDTSLERPAFTSDTYASPGDGSSTPLTAWFELPEYVHPDGSECRVAAVVVEFVNYNTGSATANTFTVEITTTRQMNTAGGTVATTQVWTMVGTPGNDLCREEFFFNAPAGHGFKVKIDAIKGVAIDRIEVRCDVEGSMGS